MTSHKKLNSALDKLFSLHQFGIKLGLENTRNLLSYLGNPEKKLKAFHIAGSNGKGSTAAFMNSILMEAGYKTGLYTSPHYVRFNERIRINGIEIPDDYIINFMSEVDTYIDKHKPTFFELTTAMTFKYFSENEIDYAVIETGLGGRLDSTNVLASIASIITTISKEHTNILSDDIEKIAWEKGSIIKNNSYAFVGEMDNSAKEVIRKMAMDADTKYYDLLNHVRRNNNSVKLEIDDFVYTIHDLPLLGFYQKLNASLAILTLNKALGINKWRTINNGLKNISKNSGVQGKYEVYCERPRVIFDSAHNPQSLQLFLESFADERKNYKKCTVVFGCMRDKNYIEMLKLLNEQFDEIFVTSINYERAATTKELIETGNKINITLKEINQPDKYVTNFVNSHSDNCLVVLGSIYLLGQIKSELSNNLS